jgi:epoxide hydrolase-like predicted phosphatase
LNNMVKAISFDMDGVYFNGKENFIANIAALGVDEEEVRRVFLDSHQMNRQYKTGEWTDEQFWAWAVKEWNLSKPGSEIMNLMIECYKVNHEIVDLVKKVRANGYKTMVCTNNFPARVNGLQQRFKFLDNFDVKVLSYEVGFIKPDVQIFRVLVEKAGISPEEMLITDDNQIALKIAKDLGMQTHLYENVEKFKETLTSLDVKID